MQTDNLELKKLVYLYLMNYAKSQPDMAIMAVNTFVKVRVKYFQGFIVPVWELTPDGQSGGWGLGGAWNWRNWSTCTWWIMPRVNLCSDMAIMAVNMFVKIKHTL